MRLNLPSTSLVTEVGQKKGTPAKTIVPSARSASITILGAISVDGFIDISLKKPTSSVGSKKKPEGKRRRLMAK